MMALARLADRHPRIISAIFLLTAITAGLLTEFRIGHSYKDWIDTHGLPYAHYQTLVENFGDAETLLAVFELSELNERSTPSYFALIKKLRAMDGVVGIYEPAGLLLGATKDYPPEQIDIDILRAALESQPADYRNAIISRDARYAGLLVLVDSNKHHAQSGILQTLEHGFEGLGIDADLAGTVYFSENLSRAIATDMALINTLLFTAAIALLVYFFGNLWLALCVAGGIGLAILFSLAACLALGLTINLLTLLLIPLVYCVGLTTSIHLFARRQSSRWHYLNAIQRISRPAAIAALTTAIGCATFMFAPQPVVARMGMVLPLGVLFSFITTLFFVPALLKTISPGYELPPIRHQAPRIVGTGKRLVSIALLIGSLLALAVLPKITINPDAIFFFADRSPVIQSYERIEKNLSGLLVSDLIINADDNESMLSDKHATQVNTLVDKLREIPEITTVVSGYDLQLIQKFGGPAAMLGKTYFAADNRIARVNIRMQNLGDRSYAEVAAEIGDIWRAHDTEGLSHYLTGVIPLILQAQDHLLSTQSVMLPVAVATICFILFIVFRSPRLLLLALIANFIPIIITVGAMVVLSIPINSINLFVSSVMIGVVVDDTVHLLHAYRETGSMTNALAEVGDALWITSLIVCIAFAALTVSELIPIQQFGLLSVIAVGSAWLCDVCLLPVLAKLGVPS